MHRPSFDASDDIEAPGDRAERPVERQTIHKGLPPLEKELHYPTFKKRLPDQVFYIVPALMWTALSIRHLSVTLPTVANPSMEAGGLWGESKSQCLSIFGPTARRWIADYVTLVRAENDPLAVHDVREAHEILSRARLRYPIIVKPDRGYQGWGVEQVNDEAQLAAYFAAIPPGTGLILQEFVGYGGEAGIFYIRHPAEPRGRIASMALTYAPHVVGDGKATLGELVDGDVVLAKSAGNYRLWHDAQWQRVLEPDEVFVLTTTRSARVGAVYRDAAHLVTPALEARIDEISKDIKEFYFGRFDIRFESVERFQRGEGFKILELNGAGAEMLDIWDGRKHLRQAYGALWRQYRTLFQIAAENARRGAKPCGLLAMVRLQARQERLRRLYPPST